MTPTRRGFLRGALVGGGALSLAVTFGCGPKNGARIAHADATGELKANAFITVLPDGKIDVAVHKAEIGQGVTTAFTTLVAEELSVALDHVKVHFADSKPVYRTTFNMHITGGSTSTKEAYVGIRRAAAAAREMLKEAAAREWHVPHGELSVENGKVVHAASKRESGYGQLTKQASRVEVPSSPPLKPAKDFTLIGKTDKRVDARDKVEGKAVFGIDVQVPNMVNACAIHGPRYGAKPTKVVADEAKKMPGVIDVIAFDWGVAVVADKYWQALAASKHVEVTWNGGELDGLDTEKLRQAMLAHHDSGTEVKGIGDAGDAFASAPTKVSGTYEAPYLAHATMEPQNAVVSVMGDRAEVWAPTQGPTIAQAFVSEAVGIDFESVLVHTTLCGGGFGRRAIADVIAQAAQISKHVKRPVKLVWSRESDMTGGFYRPVYTVHTRAAADASGNPAALDLHALSQQITLSSGGMFNASMPGIPKGIRHMIANALLAMFSTDSLPDLFASEGLSNTPYRPGNFHLAETPIQTKLPVATWRSVGNSVTGFVMESLVDELAHAAKQDPFAFRKQMLPANSKQMRVLERLAALSSWSSPRVPGVGRGLARHFSFDTECAQVADVEIVNGRIRVKRVHCVVDCGIAVNPDIVRAQVEGAVIFGLSAALDQEITVVDGVVQQTNFDTYPLLRMHEVPEIIVDILPSDEAPTGIGEPGLPPIAPAVANAVFALTGKRLRRMPLNKALAAGGAS